jgi:murein DD-endopeptidase MepM/ murein hydrolase activator NlpD
MNKKRIFKLLVLMCTILLFAIPSYGDLQDEKDKKEEMEEQLKDTESYLASLEALKKNSEAYIAAIDSRIEELALNIYALEQDAEALQLLIDAKQAEIVAKEAEIEKQYDDMALRIQYMYENGKSDSLAMLFESKNMAEFLNKAEYISALTQYDREMLVKLQETKVEYDKEKKELEASQKELNETLLEVEAEKVAQEKLLASKREELTVYDYEISGTSSQIKELEEEIKAQEALIKELEELERKRKEENVKLVYDGGKMSWPLPGYSRISSKFGYRTHPVTGQKQSFHSGIDIPAPTGTKIIAAYDGQVAWAYRHSTAGNWIGIDHGNGIFTIYMHMSAFIAREGQYVKKGDVIGLVGSTGRSTGPHLHFGIRVNGEYIQPLNYVVAP